MDFIAELKAYSQMMRSGRRAEFKYANNYELVLALGSSGGERLAHEYVRPKKECFKNCFDLVRQLEGEYYYCEGFAQPPETLGMIFDHAWLVDPEGRVLDPTWHGDSYAGTNYFGIAFDWDYVRQRALKTKVYGILGDYSGEILRDGLPIDAVALSVIGS